MQPGLGIDVREPERTLRRSWAKLHRFQSNGWLTNEKQQHPRSLLSQGGVPQTAIFGFIVKQTSGCKAVLTSWRNATPSVPASTLKGHVFASNSDIWRMQQPHGARRGARGAITPHTASKTSGMAGQNLEVLNAMSMVKAPYGIVLQLQNYPSSPPSLPKEEDEWSSHLGGAKTAENSPGPVGVRAELVHLHVLWPRLPPGWRVLCAPLAAKGVAVVPKMVGQLVMQHGATARGGAIDPRHTVRIVCCLFVLS